MQRRPAAVKRVGIEERLLDDSGSGDVADRLGEIEPRRLERLDGYRALSKEGAERAERVVGAGIPPFEAEGREDPSKRRRSGCPPFIRLPRCPPVGEGMLLGKCQRVAQGKRLRSQTPGKRRDHEESQRQEKPHEQPVRWKSTLSLYNYIRIYTARQARGLTSKLRITALRNGEGYRKIGLTGGPAVARRMLKALGIAAAIAALAGIVAAAGLALPGRAFLVASDDPPRAA